MDPPSPLFEADRTTLGSREMVLLRKLCAEYTPQLARDVLLPLIDQTSPVSLRALDWAVTNWSKVNNVICSSPVAGEYTNVHQAYVNTLAFWKRKLFDPFRRRKRITLRLDGRAHETTLGQANFALFAYRTGVLSYVLGHIDAIEAHMNETNQAQKRKRQESQKTGVRRKRTELTRGAPLRCVAILAPSHVRFD